jgi:hypothetical protein
MLTTYSALIWFFLSIAAWGILVLEIGRRLARKYLGDTAEPMGYGSIFVILIMFSGIALVRAIFEFHDTSLNADSFLSDPSTIVLAVLASLYLYWLRGQLPFLYGILEVILGVVTISLVSINARGDALARVLAILGGSYIIVRGMDNMDKGCPPPLRGFWDAVFPKRAAAKT